MINVEGLDFELRSGIAARKDELRLCLHIASTGELAAWVHVMPPGKDGKREIFSQDMQQPHFTNTQKGRIRRWLKTMIDAAAP
ncbi:hypothetical protein K2Q00_02815 [Patescibacteria group bacterium]|nr:hypothetical protein [Patescibacteria group bacterium]